MPIFPNKSTEEPLKTCVLPKNGLKKIRNLKVNESPGLDDPHPTSAERRYQGTSHPTVHTFQKVTLRAGASSNLERYICGYSI